MRPRRPLLLSAVRNTNCRGAASPPKRREPATHQVHSEFCLSHQLAPARLPHGDRLARAAAGRAALRPPWLLLGALLPEPLAGRAPRLRRGLLVPLPLVLLLQLMRRLHLLEPVAWRHAAAAAAAAIAAAAVTAAAIAAAAVTAAGVAAVETGAAARAVAAGGRRGPCFRRGLLV